MQSRSNPVPRNKFIWAVFFLMILLICGAMYYGVHSSNEKNKIDGVVLKQPQSIENFQLTDHHGKSFTKTNLLGRWTMMFFGFTHCGYVCPSTLSELNKMYQMLQNQISDKELPQVVMVSVDPERDSVLRMKQYVLGFNSHFIGTRGTLPATNALENQLHITAARMQSEGLGKDHYTINHSAEIILFNPRGEIQAYFSFPHSAEQMVKDYKSILKTHV